MSQVNDGGPAFPRAYSKGDLEKAQSGMSLRDYFAGQFLIGFAGSHIREYGIEDLNASASREWVAAKCYQMADAMLKAREVKDGV